MGERTFFVEVTQLVEVKLDTAKFDEAFMAEFRESFFQFDTIEEHAEHIAQMQARGVIEADAYSGDFIEGYGPSKEMGIDARVTDTEMLLVQPVLAA